LKISNKVKEKETKRITQPELKLEVLKMQKKREQKINFNFRKVNKAKAFNLKAVT